MKKRGMSSFYVVLFGIVIFILLLIPTGKIAGNVWNALTGKSSGNEKSLEEFTAALLEVAAMPGEVAGDLYSFSLNQETALIVMNPGKDFKFVYPDPSSVERARYFPMISIRGSVFSRPNSCSGEDICICLCEKLDFESEATDLSSEKIVCSRTSCVSTNYFFVKEKLLLDHVFSFDYDSFKTEGRFSKEILSRKDEVYWDNSMIFVRHPHVGKDAGGTTEWTTHKDNIAGYGYFILPQRFDVFIYKAGVRDGKPVISICFKKNPEENCFPRMGPFQ